MNTLLRYNIPLTSTQYMRELILLSKLRIGLLHCIMEICSETWLYNSTKCRTYSKRANQSALVGHNTELFLL